MFHLTIRRICANAVVAAIYVVLTMASYPFSYGMIQVRISEALILLCFFRKDYTIGLTLGCIIANCISFSPYDMLFGSLATLASCLIISFSKNLFFSTLVPVVINAFVVGSELFFLLEEPFWTSVGFVAAGEAIAVVALGYTLFMVLGRKKFFQNLIEANQNLDFKW